MAKKNVFLDALESRSKRLESIAKQQEKAEKKARDAAIDKAQKEAAANPKKGIAGKAAEFVTDYLNPVGEYGIFGKKSIAENSRNISDAANATRGAIDTVLQDEGNAKFDNPKDIIRTAANIPVGLLEGVANAPKDAREAITGKRLNTDESGKYTGAENDTQLNTAQRVGAGVSAISNSADVFMGGTGTLLKSVLSSGAKTVSKSIVKQIIKDAFTEGGENLVQSVAADLQASGKIDEDTIKRAASSFGVGILTGGVMSGTGRVISKLRGDNAKVSTEPIDVNNTTPSAPQLQLEPGYRRSSEIEADIKRIQNGDFSGLTTESTTKAGNFNTSNISDATNKQLEILNQQKDVLNSKLAAQEINTPMYEKTVKDIDALDSKINELTGENITPTGEPGTSVNVDTATVREKFKALQEELAIAKAYEENLASAGTISGPKRTIDQVRADKADIEAGKIPEDAYDAPSTVTNAEDIMNHPGLEKAAQDSVAVENVRRAGLLIQKDKDMAQNQLKDIFTEADGDIAKSKLDAEYQAKMDELETLPDARKQYEQQNLTDEYMQEIQKIDDEVAAQQPEAEKWQGVLDAVLQKERELVGDTNTLLANNQDSFKTVNESKLNEIKYNLAKEEYTMASDATPSQTGAVLSDAIDSGAKLDEVAAVDPTVDKAISNKLDDDIANVKETKNWATNIFSSPITTMAKWGDIGKQLAQRVVDAVRASEKDEIKFSKTLKDWNERAANIGNKKEVLTTISKALDGDATAKSSLTGDAAKIYNEARMYFNKAAIENGLPEGSRITEYFPHMFGENIDTLDKAIIQLANNKNAKGEILTTAEHNKLQKQVAGLDYETQQMIRKNSQYTLGENGFLKKRTGAEGYSLDFNDVLVAYNRASSKTKFYTDLFDYAKDNSKYLSSKQNEYLAKELHNLGARPIDEIGDELNKMIAGITNGNVTYDGAVKKAQKLIYGSSMGLNIGSAARNFTQNSNTIAELGFGKTATGALEYMKAKTKDSKMFNELIDNGVLTGTYNEALRGGGRMSKFDNVMWGLFNATEEFNRGTAYFAGKADALARGLSEADAMKFGRDMAEKTQFKFDNARTPLIAQSTTAKAITQFQNYNLNQAKLIASWFGGKPESMFYKTVDGNWQFHPEAAKKIVRYIAANAAFMAMFGSAMGMNMTDIIPFYDDVKEGQVPQSPIVTWIKGDQSKIGLAGLLSEGSKAIFGGDEESQKNIGGDLLSFAGNTVLQAIPGSSQIKKSIEGADSVMTGEVKNAGGNTRFLQNQDAGNSLRALLFGKYATDAGKEWVSGERSTLTPKQTETISILPDAEKQQFYDYYTNIKQATGRQDALDEIKSAAADGDINRAVRAANDFNKKVDKVMAQYYAKNEELPEELKTLLHGSVMIDVKKTIDNAQD